MSTSMFVAKADGEREMLSSVSRELAGGVFAKMDWAAELAAMHEAEDAMRESYIPEFGLTDEEERQLVLTPDEEGTISVVLEYPDHAWGIDGFPWSEVDQLLDLYFAGDDDGLADLITKYLPPPEMTVHELSNSEFQTTLVPPLRRLGDEQSYRPVRLRAHLEAALEALALPASLETVELEVIFLTGDKQYSHFLFIYGNPGRWLVLVVQHDVEHNRDDVLGFHLVDVAGNPYE